jgi:hypothetical protein
MFDRRLDVVVAVCDPAGRPAALAAGAGVAVPERAPPRARGGRKSGAGVTNGRETYLAEDSSGHVAPDLTEESARPVGERAPCAPALADAIPDGGDDGRS